MSCSAVEQILHSFPAVARRLNIPVLLVKDTHDLFYGILMFSPEAVTLPGVTGWTTRAGLHRIRKPSILNLSNEFECGRIADPEHIGYCTSLAQSPGFSAQRTDHLPPRTAQMETIRSRTLSHTPDLSSLLDLYHQTHAESSLTRRYDSPTFTRSQARSDGYPARQHLYRGWKETVLRHTDIQSRIKVPRRASPTYLLLYSTLNRLSINIYHRHND